MTSQLEAVVVGEFFSRAVGECDCPKNGDVLSNDSQRLETDAIQKFLSVCLKQYFHCFPDNTKETPEGNNVGSQLSADVSCKFCKDDMVPVTLALKNHLDVCPLFPVKCPNMCGKMEVPREKLSNHIMEECPKTCEQCVYHDIGCAFQGPRSDLTKHLQDNSEEHLQLALEVIKEQRTEMGIQRGRLRKQEENINQLMESVGKLTALCEETLKNNADQEKTMNRLSEQLKEQKKHQSKHEKELRQRMAELEKHEPEMPQNGLARYPGLNGYGELVWRISNFSRRLQRVQSGRGEDPMTSEPFYTSAFGYKIVVWAYINGRGKETGRSLSLYACVLCGEYDAVLSWPIKPRYTFSLLDQNPDPEARKDLTRTRKVHDFKRDDVRRKGIDRPGRDERAIIVGFDDFVRHEELEAGNFLADDILFVRILVDIPES